MVKTGYVDVKIKIGNKVKNGYKMEIGCSFENNGNIYRMNNDGLLSVFDKKEGIWKAGIREITMTNYQIDTFEAVANNNDETNGKEVVLSKKDIDDALNLFRDKKLTDDLSEFSKNNYSQKDVQAYSSNNAFSSYVTNGNKKTSGTLIFKYGSADDAVKLSDFVLNDSAEEGIQVKKTAAKRTGEMKPAKKMKISNNGKQLVKNAEGWVPYTYDDADTSKPKKFIKKGMSYKGTLTIGWGHTKGVKPGQQISNVTGEQYLNQDLAWAVKAVQDNVKVDITQNMFDALVVFTYNVGEINFKNSTLLKKVNAKDFDSASAWFGKYIWGRTKGGKLVKIRGLVNRRASERKLFDT